MRETKTIPEKVSNGDRNIFVMILIVWRGEYAVRQPDVKILQD